MNDKKKLKNYDDLPLVLDVDDVLLDCNRYALSLLSERDGVPYSIEKVTAWGELGIPEDDRLQFLNNKSFYLRESHP